MKISSTTKSGILFLFGFLCSYFLMLFFVYSSEIPFSFEIFNLTKDNESAPFDFIKEEQIKVYNDRIIIEIENASISRYAPTGSMKPVLDEGSNGIRIKPDSEEDIHIGDVITFKKDEYSVIHRVIDKGFDKDGWYFITKGDNNNLSDGKIRFEDIEYITIGVIW